LKFICTYFIILIKFCFY